MRLVDDVRAELVRSGEPATAATVAAAIRRRGLVLGADDLARTTEQVHADLLGAGPLQRLLADESVTDVVVNAPDAVYVDRGDGLVPTTVRFRDEAAVRLLAQRLAAGAGRRLDEARPWVDARLSTGVRLHAVLPPLAVPGTLLSLRIPARRPFDLPGLIRAGSVPAWAAPWVAAVIGRRLSFLVTGGTGTGKTTVLATLLSLVDRQDRIVLVEDSGELAPDHPHVVRLQARPANVEGAGEIGLDVLVRQALRMRPDRLVVGEVRGPEVRDMLAALNTGHDGGCATLHANAAEQVPARLEALAQAAGMGRDALHSQVAAGVQVVVHLTRAATGHRAVAVLGVVERRGGLTEVVPALLLTGAAHDGSGCGAATGARSPGARTADGNPGAAFAAVPDSLSQPGAVPPPTARGPGYARLCHLLDVPPR
jgi:pilus assembly protein CpaF